MKTCTTCRCAQPLDHFNVDRSRADGRGYICADCRAARRMAAGPTIRERRSKAADGLKWCRGCQDWRAFTGQNGACQPCINREERARYARDDDYRARRVARAVARRRGRTEPANVVPACTICNSSKRANDVWDWLAKTGRSPHPAFFDRVILVEAGLFPPTGATAI
jgi:hypothetical protein